MENQIYFRRKCRISLNYVFCEGVLVLPKFQNHSPEQKPSMMLGKFVKKISFKKQFHLQNES